MDHPRPDAQQGCHQRPLGRICADHLLDLCRGIHCAAHCRREHHLQADFQEVENRPQQGRTTN